MSGISFVPSPGVDDDAFTVCTSDTRPTTPFVGQMIYETDTKMTLQYSGTGWGPLWSQPWGVQGVTKATTGASGITTATELVGLTTSFTFVENRNYRISAQVYMSSSVAADTSSLALVVDGNQVQSGQAVTNSTGSKVYIEYVGSIAAGTKTIRVDAARAAGTGSISVLAGAAFPAILTVEDIGPVLTTVGGLPYPVNTNASNYQICTSSTRPASPFHGLQIYETDTKKTLYYDTTLGWVPPWNTAWGLISSKRDTTRRNNVTVASDISTVLADTFTAVAGRQYKITGIVFIDFRPASTANCVLYVYKNSSYLDVLAIRTEQATGTYLDTYNGSYIDTPGAGSVTYSLRAESPDNPDIRNDVMPGKLIIEDVGPA